MVNALNNLNVRNSMMRLLISESNASDSDIRLLIGQDHDLHQSDSRDVSVDVGKRSAQFKTKY